MWEISLSAPIVVLNIDGFYDSLIALVDSLITNNAAIPEVRTYFDVVDSVDDELIVKRFNECK